MSSIFQPFSAVYYSFPTQLFENCTFLINSRFWEITQFLKNQWNLWWIFFVTFFHALICIEDLKPRLHFLRISKVDIFYDMSTWSCHRFGMWVFNHSQERLIKYWSSAGGTNDQIMREGVIREERKEPWYYNKRRKIKKKG